MTRIPLPMAPAAPAPLVVCTECGKCCTYVSVGINEPSSVRNASDILWYLYHEQVSIYRDGDGEWSVVFETRCRHLAGEPALRRVRRAAHHLPRLRQHDLRRQRPRRAASPSPRRRSSWSGSQEKRPRLYRRLAERYVPAALRRGRGRVLKVLVVGGNRFVGYDLVWRLLAGGHDVTLFNRGTLPDPFGGRVERLHGDRTTDEFDRALAGRRFDAAVDFAGFVAADVERAVRVLEGRVGHYVFISTGQVYLVREPRPSPARETDYDGPVDAGAARRPSRPRGLGLRRGQARLRGRAGRGLRPRRAFPPRACASRWSTASATTRGGWRATCGGSSTAGPCSLPDGGTHRLRHVYSRDVARAIAGLLGQPPHASARPTTSARRRRPTLVEMLETLAALLGAPSRLRPIPARALEAAGLDPVRVSPFSGRWMSLLDPARARAELGFVRHARSPPTSPPSWPASWPIRPPTRPRPTPTARAVSWPAPGLAGPGSLAIDARWPISCQLKGGVPCPRAPASAGSRPRRRGGAAPERGPHPRRPARGRAARPAAQGPGRGPRGQPVHPLPPGRAAPRSRAQGGRAGRPVRAPLPQPGRAPRRADGEGAALAARPEPPPRRRIPPSGSAPSPASSMPSNIWTRCAGRSSLRALPAAPGASSSRSTSSPRASWSTPTRSSALLEELIEDVKPPPGAPAGLHYLLFTPFRYPPLRHGSRFGTRAERGIWYGSRTRATAFAEKAYYLLLFLEGTAAELTPLETDVSIFQAAYETRAGGGPHARRLRALPARSSPRRPTTRRRKRWGGRCARTAWRPSSTRPPAIPSTAPTSACSCARPSRRAGPACRRAGAAWSRATAVEVTKEDVFRSASFAFKRRDFEVDGRLPAPAFWPSRPRAARAPAPAPGAAPPRPPGTARSSSSSVSTMTSATARRVNHLWSAGMTYQGASSVVVASISVLVGLHVLVPVLALLDVRRPRTSSSSPARRGAPGSACAAPPWRRSGRTCGSRCRCATR